MVVKPDDDELEPDPSLGTDQDDAADKSDAAATSSTATGDKAQPEITNFVRDVDEDRASRKAAVSPTDDAKSGTTAGGAATQKELDNENFTDVPFHKHPRFQTVIRERNSFRDDAGRYRNVQSFLDRSGLSSEEAADGLQIMAQAKVDPVGAWTAIKPWVQRILIAAGEVLPDELQRRVTANELSVEAAMEINRSQARANSLAAKQTFDERRREEDAKRSAADELVNTANDWEAERLVKDPNYAAKTELIQREVLWLQNKEGRPSDRAGVLKQLNAAYEAANKAFKPQVVRRAAPQQRPAIRPVVTGQSQVEVRAKPRTTHDIVEAELAKRASA